jgi:hypothetical protein
VFRRGYEQVVLKGMPRGSAPPTIAEVDTQVDFPGFQCRPDLLLGLADGRSVVCEHRSPQQATWTDRVAVSGLAGAQPEDSA